MSHGEADVDLHAMRTLHARCRPASCVSFFFFFLLPHTLSLLLPSRWQKAPSEVRLAWMFHIFFF